MQGRAVPAAAAVALAAAYIVVQHGPGLRLPASAAACSGGKGGLACGVGCQCYWWLQASYVIFLMFMLSVMGLV